jgi:hypothetical protein
VPDLLEDILAVEREIAEMIGAEQSKAVRWLDESKQAIDRDARAELARLQEAAAQDEIAAKKVAAEQAAGLIEQSRSVARRIEALDDAQLRPIVSKHLTSIVPGAKP